MIETDIIFISILTFTILELHINIRSIIRKKKFGQKENF